MNKRIIIVWMLCCVFFISARSQKTLSLYVTGGSGVSYFRGSGSVNSSVFYRNNLPFPNQVDTVREQFGRQALTNFTAGMQANLRLLPGIILTVDAQYERSGGELQIDSVYAPSGNFKTSGAYKQQYDFISLNPQLGSRISIGPIGVRISAGVDYCVKLNKATTANYMDQSGKTFSIGGTGGEPEVNDIRLTIGAALNIKKFAININYKYGVVDYLHNRPGQAYSRLLQVRLLYRLLAI